MSKSYIVITGHKVDEDFEDRVEEYLNSGWILQGGVALDRSSFIYQAMYKPAPGRTGE